MPAHRKPVALHQLHGTYQPCRHDNREEPARNKKQRRTIPPWLPDEVKAIYRKLAELLPPLNAIDETTLIQLALLKHRLQSDPDGFTVQEHNQLRQLTTVVRGWIAAGSEVKEPDDLEQWMRNRQHRKGQSEH